MNRFITNISVKPNCIVGAGPGNPELLTLKALRALQLADVILFDELAQGSFELFVKPDAELIDVGKRFDDGLDQDERQLQIHQLWLQGHKQGKRTVRLKGGDPMVFGKIVEEIEFLVSNQIDFEIIPGISAALGASALCNIPLTIRGKASELVITTAQKLYGEEQELLHFIPHLLSGSPLMVYMGGTRLEKIIKQLIELNMPDNLYINIISNVSLSNQHIMSFTLHQYKMGLELKVELPAIIVIGLHAKPLF